MSLHIDDLIELVGTEVENHKGEILGTIDDIRVDEQRNIPEYLILCCHDLFGEGNRYFAIPAHPLLINFDQYDKITIPVEKEDLKVATGVHADECPKFDPQFSESIFELLHYSEAVSKKKKP